MVTLLHNRAMPLIRYPLGTWARRLTGRCACGRYLPRVELVDPRKTDMVHTSRVPAASSLLFDQILIELIDRGQRGILQFLAIQKDLDRFLVKVVPGPEFARTSLDFFEERMRQRLGDQIIVEFQLVEEIPQPAEGKIQYFKSEIEQGSEPRV